MPNPVLALAGASVGGAVVQGRAAGKAADAQADAAARADETQRYIFDRNVELTEPQRLMGQNALAALGFEAGIGPQPTFGGTSPLQITEIGSEPAFTQEPIYSEGGRGEGSLQGYRDVAYENPMRFAVGDQVFDSREQAQAFIDQQPQNMLEGGMQYQPIGFPEMPDFSREAFEASPGYDFRVEEGMKAIERAASARGLRLSGSALKDAARFNQGTASDEYGAFYGRQTDRYNREYNVGADKRNMLGKIAGIGDVAAGRQINAGTNYATATGQNALTAGNAQAQGYLGQAEAVTSGINNLSNIYGMGMSGYLGPQPGLGIKPLANPFGS